MGNRSTKPNLSSTKLTKLILELAIGFWLGGLVGYWLDRLGLAWLAYFSKLTWA